MATLEPLYKYRPVEEVALLAAHALQLAKERPGLKLMELQNTLRLGYNEAVALFDWLADNHAVEPHVSNHWLRCGRAYVRNNFYTSLAHMAATLKIGDQRAFALMMALERRGMIRIQQGFSFERQIRMAAFDDLVRQMRHVGKKYRGRCEPELLVRLYGSPSMAKSTAGCGGRIVQRSYYSISVYCKRPGSTPPQ